MNDKELADRVVAFGVGKANQIYPDGIGKFYQVDVDADWQTSVNESKFVRDWRVAGALMERCLSLDYDQADEEHTVSVWTAASFTGPSATIGNESLPRAIIEACCEALCEKGA